MANNILLKKSSVAAKVPTTGDLDYGELALNYADGALYYKTSSNTIARLNPLEADTLATVTGRGATTSTAITLSGDPGVSIAANASIGRMLFSKTGATTQIWQIGTSGNDATARGFNIDDYTAGATRFKIAHTTGDISLNASTFTSGIAYITNTTASTATNNGALVVSGGLGVASQIYAGGINVVAGGNVVGKLQSLSPAGGVLQLSSGTAASTTFSIVTTDYANTIAIGYTTPILIGMYGGTNIQNTTASTSTSTGALVVGGGAGIGGALYVGSNLSVNGASSLAGDVTNVDSISFDLTAAEATGIGKLYWDAGVGELRYGLGGGNVDLAIGQMQVTYCRNAETTTITKGQVVYLFGAQGDRPSVKLASNTSDTTSNKTFGIAAENIAANSDGYIVNVGTITGVDTSMYSPGDILWLGSTAGTFTTTKAVAPNHLVFIGVVQKANQGGGQIYVKPQNGYELDEIHDVLISGIGLNHSLFYDSSVNVWKNYAPSAARTNLGLGTIATQNANNVAITGGAIDGPPVGATTPSTGKFTTLQTTGDATIGGNLTVSGTTTTVNAQNLNITDNLFYLNAGSTNTNPDIGFAANYNDGTYRHAGFFRDATDGYWKVFKNYTPEPDASIYIDTSHASFALADIQAANFRGALVGNATTASTLAGTPTINGVTFNGGSNITITSNTTNALTIGDGLSGTSFNGSAAVTIAVDSTVARRSDVHYIGTTSIALNRTSAAQSLTGIDGITGSTTGVTINAGGSNQSITLTPSGTGVVSVAGTASIVKSEVNTNAITTALNYLKIQNSNSGGTYIGALEFYTWDNRRAAGIFAERNNVDGTGGTLSFAYSTSINSFTEGFRLTPAGKILLGTTTTTTNGGRFQLAPHTTTDGGIGFGTDLVLHRASANKIRLAPPDGGSATVAYELYNASGNSFRMEYGYPYAPVLHADDALTVTSVGGSITFKSNNSTTLTLNTSNGATLVGNFTANGTSHTFGPGGSGTAQTSLFINSGNGINGGPSVILQRAGGNLLMLAVAGQSNDWVGGSSTGDSIIRTATKNLWLTTDGTGTNPSIKIETTHKAIFYGDVNLQTGIMTSSSHFNLNGSGHITLNSGTGANIYLKTNNGTDVVTITSTGRVGIGNTSPSSILHIVNGASVWSLNGGGAGAPYNNNSAAFYSNAGNISITNQWGTINWPETYSTPNDTKPWWMLGNISGTAGQWKLNLRTGWDGSSGGLDREVIGVFTTGTDTTRTIDYLRFSVGAGAEALRIITGGNVGIGTPTPARKLDVNGDANIGTNLVVGTAVYASQYIAGNSTQTYWKSSTSGILLTLLENGNFTAVGTGTFQGSNVTVDGSSYSRSVYSISGTGKTEIGYGPTGYGFGGRNTGSYISYKDYLYIGTGAANAPTITILESGVGGNVGIGTAFPSYKLHVMGDARMGANGQRLYFYDDGNAHIHSTSTPFWINAEDNTSNIYINHQYNGGVILTKAGGGNVGIGEASPTQKLHVTGNARITGAIYDSANSAGTNGQVLTSTGTGTAWSSSGVAVSGTGTAGKIAKWSATTALADSVITESSGNIGIDTTPTQKLDVNGNIGWSTDYVLSSSTITTTSTTANQVITSVAATSFRTFKFIIQATDATAGKYQSQEILAVHNGSTVAHTEYTAINVGGAVATYDVDISGSTVRLLCTPLSANSTVFKVSMQLIKV